MNSSVSIEKFIDDFKQQLLHLPGEAAQKIMAPYFRFNYPIYDVIPKRSSVLIIIYPDDNELSTVLIERSQYNGYHSGQIALPGGKFEKQDASLIETALREAKEEIGIVPKNVQILGHLTSLYIPVSNITVLPIVGYQNTVPLFQLNKQEVQSLIKVKIEHLINPEIIKYDYFKTQNTKIKAPYYDIQGQKVWGATAMILSEFLSVVKQQTTFSFL